jgi:hypothetical protein
MEQAQQFMNEYGVILGGIAVILTLAWWFTRSKKVPGEGKMISRAEYTLSVREQKQAERNLVADEVSNFLLNLYEKGKISEERYQYWHLRFGTQLGLKDLLPCKKLGPEGVKKAIKTRLSKRELSYKPVPFFKEEKKVKPKNIVDGILNSKT